MAQEYVGYGEVPCSSLRSIAGRARILWRCDWAAPNLNHRLERARNKCFLGGAWQSNNRRRIIHVLHMHVKISIYIDNKLENRALRDI